MVEQPEEAISVVLFEVGEEGSLETFSDAGLEDTGGDCDLSKDGGGAIGLETVGLGG